MKESDNNGLVSLLEKNVALSQAIFEQNKKIKRRLALVLVGDYLRLALLIVPIILGAIFLPPLLKDWFGAYAELLNPPQSSATTPESQNDQSGQLKNLLKVLQSQ